MKFKILIFALILLAFTLSSCYDTGSSTGPTVSYTPLPTEISGVLDLSGSPYSIVEDSYVPQGSMLKIEPGVQICFAGFYTLTVEGYLYAVGTPDKFITFTSTVTNRIKPRGNWEGLVFVNPDQSSILEYCQVEDGALYQNGAEEVRGAIHCENSSPVIRKCLLIDNGYNAVFARWENASPLVDGCTITNNAYSGVLADTGSSPLVRNCIIVTNDDYGCFATLNSGASPRIQYCNIWDNFTTEIFGIDTTAFPGLISQDPEFADPVLADYHLLSHSPCIDAGDIGGIIDPDGSRRDMGVYFYDQSDPSEIRNALKDTLVIDYSPYFVTSNVWVEEGDTLVIEPGVELDINAETSLRFSFNIYGTLIALGNEGSEIVITSSKTIPLKGDWKYLYFHQGSSGSQLDHCEISYASEILIDTDITVTNTIFRNNEKYVKVTNTSAAFDNVLFENMGIAGLYCNDHADPEIKHCVFYQNQGHGVYCSYYSSPLLQNNIFLENFTQGVRCDTFSNPDIINNTFIGNGYNGIYLVKNSDAYIANNIVAFNTKGGISCKQASYPSIYYNDSYGHLIITADSLLSVDPVTLDSTWTVTYDSTYKDYVNCPNYVGELSMVNANQDSCDIFYNITLDPLNAASPVAALPPGSPCIDAGDPNLADPDGTVSDMGAFGGPEGNWNPPLMIESIIKNSYYGTRHY